MGIPYWRVVNQNCPSGNPPHRESLTRLPFGPIHTALLSRLTWTYTTAVLALPNRTTIMRTVIEGDMVYHQTAHQVHQYNGIKPDTVPHYVFDHSDNHQGAQLSDGFPFSKIWRYVKTPLAGGQS